MKSWGLNFFLVLLLLCSQLLVFSQNKPKLYFAKDSLAIGDTIALSLSYTHLEREEIIFPDSSALFAPFEYVGKRIFPTYTRIGRSTDSIVYLLRTFSLDSTQKLALPIFQINSNSDTSKVFTDSAYIPIKFEVTKLPDSVVLKSDTNFRAMKKDFNYPLLINISIVFLLISVVLYLFFGEKIRKMIRLRRLKHQFERFSVDYERSILHYQDAAQTDHALGLWKKFLERITEMPFSSLTTREIGEVLQGVEYDNLKMALKEIDMSIYGNQIGDKTYSALSFLKEYASSTFEQKIKQV